MRLKWILIIGIVAIAATPITLFMFGVRPKAIENRSLTPIPSIRITELSETETYSELTDYVLDRLPGRDVAVSWNATIRLRLLAESSSDQVVVGSDGWLFFAPSLDRECLTAVQASDFVREVELAHSIVEATDRELVFTIAPDKASIYPQHLGSESARAACAKATRDQILAALEREESDAVVTTWDAMGDRADIERVYHRHDTHWNSWGGALHAGVLVDTLEPGISETSATDQVAAGSYEGALTVMLGVPWSESSPQVTTTRNGVGEPEVKTIELQHDITATRTTRSAESVPMLEGLTLLLHDSFGFSLYPHLKPFFTDLTTVHETHIDYEYVRPLLANTDVVVLEKVELWAPNFVLTERLSSKMASAFLEELDSTEVAVEKTQSSVLLPAPNPNTDSVTYLVVAIDRIPGSVHEVWTSASGPDEVRKLGGFRQRVAWEMPADASAEIELLGFPDDVAITAHYVVVPLP